MDRPRTARLTSWQKWLIGGSISGLTLSGIAWLAMHYLLVSEGEFGPETSPWEPTLLQLHGAFAIPALLGIGTTFALHIPLGWQHRRQRLIGLALASVLAVLILTGYLLYYAGGENLRTTSSIVHWAIGLTLPGILGWHWLRGQALRRRRSGTGPQRAQLASVFGAYFSIRR